MITCFSSGEHPSHHIIIHHISVCMTSVVAKHKQIRVSICNTKHLNCTSKMTFKTERNFKKLLLEGLYFILADFPCLSRWCFFFFVLPSAGLFSLTASFINSFYLNKAIFFRFNPRTKWTYIRFLSCYLYT